MTDKECVIDLEEIEKVVGVKATEFKDKLESILVYLKLLGDVNIDFQFLLYMMEFEKSNFVDLLDNNQSLISSVDNLTKLISECKSIFKEKTGIDFVIQYRAIKGVPTGYFALDVFHVTVDADENLKEGVEVLLDEMSNIGICFEMQDVEWSF